MWSRDPAIRNDPKMVAARKKYAREHEKAARASRHPHEQTRRSFAAWMKRYGIDVEFVARWLNANDRRCGVCGEPLPDEGKDFAVDHDHEVGDFRGVLHCDCNTLLGCARDSVVRLEQAIRYLKTTKYRTALRESTEAAAALFAEAHALSESAKISLSSALESVASAHPRLVRAVTESPVHQPPAVH
jgi:hypothetical protein